MIDKELIKRMEFESRIAEVIPMLKMSITYTEQQDLLKT